MIIIVHKLLILVACAKSGLLIMSSITYFNSNGINSGMANLTMPMIMVPMICHRYGFTKAIYLLILSTYTPLSMLPLFYFLFGSFENLFCVWLCLQLLGKLSDFLCYFFIFHAGMGMKMLASVTFCCFYQMNRALKCSLSGYLPNYPNHNASIDNKSHNLFHN